MSDELTPLSDRELEIVRLLATGATNQQIARELVISINTVKVHLRNIYAKLNVASRTEATMVAVREGWVGVPWPAREEEPASAEAPGKPPAPALPELERDAPVSSAKRIGLVVAALLAVAVVFLPLVLQGQANGGETDPIGSVLPTVSSPTSGSRWHTRAQMPTPRNSLAVVAHDGLIYAIGGVSNDGYTGRVEVYDPQADAWTTRRAKPTPVGFVSAAVVDGKIYVPGGIATGSQPEDVLEVYDPVADLWETRASMPEPLAAYGLAAFDGRLYLFGGLNGEGYVDTVLRYDPSADAWETLAPMGKARGFLSAAALGDASTGAGRIYVVGGYDDVTEFRDNDIYDPATDTWSPQSPMELRRGGLAVVAVREKLYAIGGGMDGYLVFNETYDPRVGVWTQFETPVTEQWRGLGAAYVKPYIYAIGGWHKGNLSVNEGYQAIFQIQVPVAP